MCLPAFDFVNLSPISDLMQLIKQFVIDVPSSLYCPFSFNNGKQNFCLIDIWRVRGHEINLVSLKHFC